MKKILALAAALILTLALVSCGDKCSVCGERGDCTDVFGEKVCDDCMDDLNSMLGGF